MSRLPIILCLCLFFATSVYSHLSQTKENPTQNSICFELMIDHICIIVFSLRFINISRDLMLFSSKNIYKNFFGKEKTNESIGTLKRYSLTNNYRSYNLLNGRTCVESVVWIRDRVLHWSNDCNDTNYTNDRCTLNM